MVKINDSFENIPPKSDSSDTEPIVYGKSSDLFSHIEIICDSFEEPEDRQILARNVGISSKMAEAEISPQMRLEQKRIDAFVEKSIDYVKEQYEISRNQTILFMLLVREWHDHKTCVELGQTLGLSQVRSLSLVNDLTALVKRQLIRYDVERYNRLNAPINRYCVAKEALEALRKNQVFKVIPKVDLSPEDFMYELGTLLDKYHENELDCTLLLEDLNCLISDNMHLKYCQKFSKMTYLPEDKLLLHIFCHAYVVDGERAINVSSTHKMFKPGIYHRTIKLMTSQVHPLIFGGLVESYLPDGLGDRDLFCLTQKAKNELLIEMKVAENKNIERHNVKSSTYFPEKQLFYNRKETEQINQLTELLQFDKFKLVKERLKASGMRNGFTCLFYGAPGTGKTETVYQIARKTGRSIFVVDISETKSKWFGESEKCIKQLFDAYRSCARESEDAPILLFNEADAVLGRRIEVKHSSSVAQTENAIQNIILQEMETLDGIMIATTNLTQNFDTAFERRFLYKIRFEKPSLDAKCAIWQTMLPSLSDTVARELAETYEFSGGQIENIARKHAVESIIKGEEPTLELLHEFCRSELLVRDERARVMGFRG